MWCSTLKRRGAVAPLVAICLIAILGLVALTMDGGLLLDNKRKVQAAADAAALAAADDLFANFGAHSGSDPSGTASASALSTASADGFNNDGSTNVVTVHIPPTSGNFSGKAGYAEVDIRYNQPRSFSGIFGSGTVPVTCRAVAMGIPGSTGAVVLDLVDAATVNCTGNVNITNNGQLYVNSNDPGAVFLDANGDLTCGGLNVVGGLNNSGIIAYTGGGGLTALSSAVSDPLASIPEPTSAGLANYGDTYNNITVSTTLNPGMYGNLQVTSGTVTLNPGIYWISDKGQFSMKGGAVQGTGVMIYNDTGDAVFQNSTGPINLTPPTSSSGGTWPTGTTSATYAGISYWLARAINKEVHIENSSNVTMTGTFYAQTGFFDLKPDGATTVFSTGNYIAYKCEWCNGNDLKSKSNGTININPGSGVATQRPTLVE